MVWHRNSLGVLLQRFFFTLIIMSSVLTFMNCVDTPDSDELRQCFVHTGIPLVFVLVFVFMKVLCLREQRLILWTGFILTLIAQLLTLRYVDSEWLDVDKKENIKVQRCLVFLPCATFGLIVDVQIIVSTIKYKPVAFTYLPYECTRTFMLILGIFTTLASLVTYVFCFLTFGGLAVHNESSELRYLLYSSFLVKSLTWSPFLGLEYYDTIFEHIYHDVQF